MTVVQYMETESKDVATAEENAYHSQSTIIDCTLICSKSCAKQPSDDNW